MYNVHRKVQNIKAMVSRPKYLFLQQTDHLGDFNNYQCEGSYILKTTLCGPCKLLRGFHCRPEGVRLDVFSGARAPRASALLGGGSDLTRTRRQMLVEKRNNF